MSIEQGRNVAILENILGADNELLPPESPIESLLQQLLAKLGGRGDTAEVQIDYKILNKQNIAITHSSQTRANYNAYLILTQIGIVYVKIIEGVGTAEKLAGYTYDVTATVSGMTVNIDLGYSWNVGVIIPILNDYVTAVTFS